MLQLRSLTDRARAALALVLAAEPCPTPGALEGGPALEARVDAYISRLRAHRRALADVGSPWVRLRERLDRHLRTEAVELMDRDDVPESTKTAMTHALHRQNKVILSYHRFAHELHRMAAPIAALEGRPARVLELACGAGEFTLTMAEQARRRTLPFVMTGSDIVPAYVALGRQKALERGLSVDFLELNAFDLQSVADGAFDLVFIAQSVHHFSPGQLARCIAEARRISRRGFFAIDGRRSLWVLAFATSAAALTGSRELVHDAVVTGRKLYSEPELMIIGQLAAPEARVTVRPMAPGYSMLEVEFAPVL